MIGITIRQIIYGFHRALIIEPQDTSTLPYPSVAVLRIIRTTEKYYY